MNSALLTPVMEDYLEKIYLLIEDKGYARLADVSSLLNVFPSSATKMIQKLDEMGFVVYERYRGFVLTEKGEQLAKDLVERHRILEDFLKTIGVYEENIYPEVEGIEHYISKQTLFCISNLVGFFKENQDIKASYLEYLKKGK